MRKAVILRWASAALLTAVIPFATANARTITVDQSLAKQVYGGTKPGSGFCNKVHCYAVQGCKKGKCTIQVYRPDPGGSGPKGRGITPSSIAKGKANLQDIQLTNSTDKASSMLTAPQGGLLINSGTGGAGTGKLGSGGAAHPTSLKR